MDWLLKSFAANEIRGILEKYYWGNLGNEFERALIRSRSLSHLNIDMPTA